MIWSISTLQIPKQMKLKIKSFPTFETMLRIQLSGRNAIEIPVIKGAVAAIE